MRFLVPICAAVIAFAADTASATQSDLEAYQNCWRTVATSRDAHTDKDIAQFIGDAQRICAALADKASSSEGADVVEDVTTHMQVEYARANPVPDDPLADGASEEVQPLAPTHAALRPTGLSNDQRANGERQISIAASLLAGNLRNPVATTFRNVYLNMARGEDGREYINFCGEVNSQNGFGGMTGFHKFMLAGDRVLIGSPREFINADQICGSNAVYIDNRDYSPELRAVFNHAIGR